MKILICGFELLPLVQYGQYVLENTITSLLDIALSTSSEILENFRVDDADLLVCWKSFKAIVRVKDNMASNIGNIEILIFALKPVSSIYKLTS